MKKYRWLFLLIVLFNCRGIHAQFTDTSGETTEHTDSLPVTSYKSIADSLKIAELNLALDESRLNEMNLRLEMEALRAITIIADSIKLAERKQHIDSLRSVTAGIPVIVEDDTLYYIYAKRNGVSPRDRASGIENSILDLGKRFTLSPDSIYVENTEITTELMYKDKVIDSFTDIDALWENTTRVQLAETRREIIINKLHDLQSKYGLRHFLLQIFYFVLVLVVQGLLIWGTNKLFKYIKIRIRQLKNNKLKAISIKDYELFDTQRQVRILVFVANIFRYALILIQLIISVPILLSIFPQTKHLAYKIFTYIWNPIKSIFENIIEYIPNLFTIIIIWIAVKYLVKGIGYLAGEIQSEKLKITGFYPDWAQPTYQIVRFLLYAFMIAMIYPYLPGSNSGVFQGVSVFVGLIVSLGSSSVISNVMAGLVITYMRPFKLGDRIKLNDTVGNVLEKTPFVTRLKTPKNEIVTIPNSFIMSSHTVNYSSSARNYGLIIHSEVSYGYEVEWQVVHELLIEAALNTPGVSEQPAPFVLEVSLNDFYIMYQINAYITDADKLAQIYSDLHRNIQDLSNQKNIELLSPHYYASRDGSATTIPKHNKSKENK